MFTELIQCYTRIATHEEPMDINRNVVAWQKHVSRQVYVDTLPEVTKASISVNDSQFKQLFGDDEQLGIGFVCRSSSPVFYGLVQSGTKEETLWFRPNNLWCSFNLVYTNSSGFYMRIYYPSGALVQPICSLVYIGLWSFVDSDVNTSICLDFEENHPPAL